MGRCYVIDPRGSRPAAPDLSGDDVIGNGATRCPGLEPGGHGHVGSPGRDEIVLGDVSPGGGIHAATREIGEEVGTKVGFRPEHAGVDINDHAIKVRAAR